MFFLWIAIAFLVIVLAVLVREDWAFLTQPTRRATGRVIGHRRSEDSDGVSYLAQVEFSDAQGNVHRIEDTRGGSIPRPAVDEPIEVHYPVAAPGKGRVRHPVMRVFLYLIMLAMLAMLVAKVLGWIEG